MASLVDDLLSRQQFGERWGRHWLDVARYGESNGDDGLGRNASFPHAWRYRDYVIDALNRDIPYDRFLTEQIAGDLLPATSAEQRNRQLIATGFLAIGSKPAAAMNKNFAMDIVDDQINTVCTTVLGLTVACARCHDHKHDPISTRDYYALAGIFSSTETLYGKAGNEKLTAPPAPLHALKSAFHDNVPDRKRTPKFPTSYTSAIDSLDPLLHARLDSPSEQLTTDKKVSFAPETFTKFQSGAVRGELPTDTNTYSVTFWFKNDTKNNTHPITAYLFSRAKFGDKQIFGDHLGIGGTHDKSRTGKLFVFNGNVPDKKSVGGSTVIEPGTWNHVVLIREKERIRVFLNGAKKPEIDDVIPATFGDSQDFCIGTRSDQFAPLVGNMAELALFSRALTGNEAQTLHTASGQPRPSATLGLAMGVRDKPKPADCKVHINGDGAKLGPVVPRGFLTAYQDVAPSSEFVATKTALNNKQSGRLQLAKWLTQPNHPHTARVAVNRLWLHLFGRAIVDTPDDFGVYGSRPSHPELLDHLADRFIRKNWSIKRMIRAIVLSRTYQLDSRCERSLIDADPDNRLFARHVRRRLDAEALRDSVLHATGQLDLRPAEGSAVEQVDALINWPPGEATYLHRPSNHRSIYLCMLRHAPPPELAAFDLPDGVNIAGQRDVTMLPTQSLYLMNSPFMVEQANALAETIVTKSSGNDASRVQDCFRAVLKRTATEVETAQSIEHVRAIDKLLLPTVADTDEREVRSWASLVQALLSTSEFRYVD